MDLIDDILVLILQKIDSPVSLVRAATTCKRWHALIADAAFLRHFHSIHTSSLVAGDYFNDHSKLPYFRMGVRPRLKNQPSFIPTVSSSIDPRHFSLDFLPVAAGDHDDSPPAAWTVFDSRGSLLLLTRESSYSGYEFLDIVVCEPSTRRYTRITPQPYFNERYYYTGSYLVDGDADVAGGHIGMSNFRVIWMFIHFDMAERASFTGTTMFVSGRGSSWSCTDPKVTLGSPNDDINQKFIPLKDLGRAGGCRYFYGEGRNLVVLDGGTGEFSHSVLLPNWAYDFDQNMWRNRFYVADGRDGKPRIVTVFDKTMKVYARIDDGEWALEKSLLLPEATRGLPGYKDKFFSQPEPLYIITRAPGYVILSPKTLDKWLISVNLETFEVGLAAEDMGTKVYQCEIPWPLVLNSMEIDYTLLKRPLSSSVQTRLV